MPNPPATAAQGHIWVNSFCAPVYAWHDGYHLIVIIRSEGTLGNYLDDVSRKLTFAPDKVRELQKEGWTKI